MTSVAPAVVPSTVDMDCCPASKLGEIPACKDSSASEVLKKAEAAAASAMEVTSEKSTNRLAAVNNFTLNKDEPKRTLQELVQDVMAELEKGEPKDLNRLYNIMMSYDYSLNEWKRFEYWDDNKKYTRNLIASVPGSFALMLLCWNPQKGSPVHNHAGSECFARVIHGQLVEKQYVVKNGEGDLSAKSHWNELTCTKMAKCDLQKSHESVYETGLCTFINDSLGVHQVENPFSEKAVSLHMYIPGYEQCKSWCADEDETCMKVQRSFISFDTEQGEKTHE